MTTTAYFIVFLTYVSSLHLGVSAVARAYRLRCRRIFNYSSSTLCPFTKSRCAGAVRIVRLICSEFCVLGSGFASQLVRARDYDPVRC
ncbi:hypothetical protein NDA17_005282 [Ustilago hordei]|nr:hypothetical protein NDA17_005282 [Ustilago hordei]